LKAAENGKSNIQITVWFKESQVIPGTAVNNYNAKQLVLFCEITRTT